MKSILSLAMALVSCLMANARVNGDVLELALADYCAGKDAKIGVAVITDDGDTIAVNGHAEFPMLSVYKLPIAVAFGKHFIAAGEIVPEYITVTQADLHPDTYSPMRAVYDGIDSVDVTVHELLTYSLQQSDNNASDILLKAMGGVGNVEVALSGMGAEGISVLSTEDEMHADNSLCYRNSTTPIDMARFVDVFDRECNDTFSMDVKLIMETCQTGTSRLIKPLAGTGAVVGHKTGTGFTLPDGRLMAVNDVGYVHLLDGRSYTIAVFVADSGYDMVHTEKLIADISDLVYRHFIE